MNKDGRSSKYVKNEVKWRLFDQTVSEVRKVFIDVPTRELNTTIDEAIENAREEMRRGFEAGLK